MKQITYQHDGQRLDVVLADLYNISRSYASQLISGGLATLNNDIVKPGVQVNASDMVDINFPPTNQFTQKLKINIINQHKDFLTINKPQGLLVHNKDNKNAESTVLNQVKQYIENEVERGGIVHRLDRDTSGVMLVARTSAAHAELKQLFQDRTITKTYIAEVDGMPRDSEAVFKWPIVRAPKSPALFKVDANGKPAETRMKVLKVGDTSRVELKPTTGRTHQLRVHMAHYGHPIIGDRFYNPNFKEGQLLMLHAHRISFKFNGQPFEFVAQIPDRFNQ